MFPRFLRQTYSLEKNFFLIPSLSLRIIGFYPDVEHRLSVGLRIWAVFNFTVLLTGTLAELWYGIRYLSIDALKALDALCPVATSIMTIIKISIVWLHRREFAELIGRLRNLLAEQTSTPEKIYIKQRRFTLTTRLTSLTFCLVNSTATAYAMRPLISNAWRLLFDRDGGKTFEYSTPYKMVLPDLLLSMPIYPITYIVLSWHGYLTGMGASALDTTFLSFCMYFGVLLRCLQEDLKLILNENIAGPSTYLPDRVCQAKLCRIINRQNELYEMINEFSRISVVITLGHFVTSSMIICMSVIDMMLNSGFNAILYVVHSLAVSSEVCLYCIGGQEVIDTSEAVSSTIYESRWYVFDLKLQKMMLLIIQRSQRPFLIRVPFFAPSIPVLASILRFAGSLITLLRTIL